jgi:hypothetical protein
MKITSSVVGRGRSSRRRRVLTHTTPGNTDRCALHRALFKWRRRTRNTSTEPHIPIQLQNLQRAREGRHGAGEVVGTKQQLTEVLEG